MKFLIDECLSPQLATMAQNRGYGESSHIVWLSLAGMKDWDLIKRVVAEDWTLVTKNSCDFRGPPATPGTPGLHATQAIHAGLVCLNGPPGMNLALQEELFEQAMDKIAALGDDLVNQVLEVTADKENITIDRYMLPKP
ncbi:DUF5615 family PIN-like protein [Novacetimonas pomaceti]|uniref:DUF5615 family PIN-like protein n=1 Tax=Novacetimonas pomaceti TaxID=2021998 RepID=UPI001C2D4B75|nr:DUF5615 family PIN-like protein [Novacetimonas pomaceti]MBV1835051.1 DUF5615 family PIN-like protein [Novacetimonas pomaceti]